MRLIHKAYILLVIVTFSLLFIPTVSAATKNTKSSVKVLRKSLKPKLITYTPTRKVPTTTPSPKPIEVAPQSSSASADEIKSFLIDKVNEYRRSQSLSEVKMDLNTCDFAKTRAKEISETFNHDGFRNRIDSKTLPYNDYSEVTENIAMTSNYQEVIDLWIDSPSHAANMRKDTPFVCIEKYGNYFAYEGWRP